MRRLPYVALGFGILAMALHVALGLRDTWLSLSLLGAALVVMSLGGGQQARGRL